MKILLTGHLGFVGTHILFELIKVRKQFNIIGYDIEHGDDILDKRKLEFLFETEYFDTVIHLAALTGARRGELYPEDYFKVNVIGTKNLVDMAEKYGVKHFIHFSSSSVLRPNTIYGISKLAGEEIVRRSELIHKIIRPFTLIGLAGRKDQVLNKWCSMAEQGLPIRIHGEDTTRNFTYVGDVVKYVKNLLEDLHWASETVELCNPESITLKELKTIFSRYYKTADWLNSGLEKYEMPANKGRWDAPFKATNSRKIINDILKNEK